MPKVRVVEEGGLIYLYVYGVPLGGSRLSEELENWGFYYDYGQEAWVSVASDRWEARRVIAGLQKLGFECMGPRFYCEYPERFIPDFKSSELIWDTVRSVVRSLRR